MIPFPMFPRRYCSLSMYPTNNPASTRIIGLRLNFRTISGISSPCGPARTSADPAYGSCHYRCGDALHKGGLLRSPEISDLTHVGLYVTLQSRATLHIRLLATRQCPYDPIHFPHRARAALRALSLRCALVIFFARATPPAFPALVALSVRSSALRLLTRAGPPFCHPIARVQQREDSFRLSPYLPIVLLTRPFFASRVCCL